MRLVIKYKRMLMKTVKAIRNNDLFNEPINLAKMCVV